MNTARADDSKVRPRALLRCGRHECPTGPRTCQTSSASSPARLSRARSSEFQHQASSRTLLLTLMEEQRAGPACVLNVRGRASGYSTVPSLTTDATFAVAISVSPAGSSPSTRAAKTCSCVQVRFCASQAFAGRVRSSVGVACSCGRRRRHPLKIEPVRWLRRRLTRRRKGKRF
jgi:hypothetical protein